MVPGPPELLTGLPTLTQLLPPCSPLSLAPLLTVHSSCCSPNGVWKHKFCQTTPCLLLQWLLLLLKHRKALMCEGVEETLQCHWRMGLRSGFIGETKTAKVSTRRHAVPLSVCVHGPGCHHTRGLCQGRHCYCPFVMCDQNSLALGKEQPNSGARQSGCSCQLSREVSENQLPAPGDLTGSWTRALGQREP